MAQKGISIIICCFNSAPRLLKTLEHLAKQEFKNTIPVELIIVDNASTDATKEVALTEWKKYTSDISFRIIDEETPGQMYARRKGVKESQYEYILFCDDDNWLQSDYVQIAFDLMESNDRVGASSGKSIAVSDIDFPEWFSDFENSYAVGEQSEILKEGRLWGAGLVTRKSLLNKVFDEKHHFLNQGRTGNILTSGDDCEICKRILLLGNTLHYEKSLVLHHYIAPNRLTWAYKKKLFEGFEFSTGILKKYELIYKEINKSMIHKVKGVLYNILRILKSDNSPHKIKLKTELFARLGLIFKSTKISNDLEYRCILKFYLENN